MEQEKFKKAIIDWYENGKGNNIKENYFPFKEKIEKFEKLVNGNDTEEFTWLEDHIENPSIKYIIPNIVQGDYENANFFQCLYNPKVEKEIWELKTNGTFEDFKEKLKNVDEKDTSYILKQYEAINGGVCPENFIILKHNKFYDELKLIEEKFFDSSNKEKFKKDPKLEEVTNDKDLKAFINHNCYYIANYYKGVLSDGIKVTYIDGACNFLLEENFKQYLDKAEGFRICNLELVPFPTPDKNKFFPKDCKEFEYQKFSVAIVLSRIAKYLKEGGDIQPTFVFRSMNDWIKAITKFIKDENISKKIKSEEIKEILSEFFFSFPNANGALSSNNIIHACTKEKIKKDEYENRIRKYFK